MIYEKVWVVCRIKYGHKFFFNTVLSLLSINPIFISMSHFSQHNKELIIFSKACFPFWIRQVKAKKVYRLGIKKWFVNDQNEKMENLIRDLEPI